MKRPSADQILLAVDWLNSNDGDEASDLKAVSRWLEETAKQDALRQACREAGVPVALARKRLKGLEA